MNDVDIVNQYYSIKMELLEMDHKLPSFKMKVEIAVYHSTEVFKYIANSVWFECVIWDEFINSLKNENLGQEVNIILKDMGEGFNIILKPEGNTVKLSLLILKESLVGSYIELKFSQVLDNDDYMHLKESFSNFIKWW